MTTASFTCKMAPILASVVFMYGHKHTTHPMPNYQKGLLALAILIVLACLLFFMPIGYVAKDGSNIPLQVELSKATTYITEPLDKYGRPDYLAAVGRRKAPPGVTPENNAWAGVIEAIGWCPHWFTSIWSSLDDDKEVLTEEGLWRYKQLGLRPPRPESGGLISLEDYVKVNPEKFKRLDIGPIYRAYLKANEEKEGDEKKDVGMIPEWLIRVAVYNLLESDADFFDKELRESMLADPESSIFRHFTTYDDESVECTDIEALSSTLLEGLEEGVWSRKFFPELGDWFDANRPRFAMMCEALERPRFYLPFGNEKYTGYYPSYEGILGFERGMDISDPDDPEEVARCTATPDDHLLAGRPKFVSTSVTLIQLQFARLFACYAYDAAAQNNFDGVLRSFQAMQKLADGLVEHKHPTLVEMLIGVTIYGIINETATQLVGMYELTAEQLADFEKWLATMKTRIPFENAFFLERFSALESYLTISDYVAIDSRRSLYAWLKNRWINWDEAMRVTNEDFDLATEAFNEQSKEKIEVLAQRREQRKEGIGSLTWSVALMRLLIPDFKSFFLLAQEKQRGCQLLGLALALRKNQITTGDLPENLKDALSQEEQVVLKKLSEYKEKYVHYQKTSDTTFQLKFTD